jgi:hypothetical protein
LGFTLRDLARDLGLKVSGVGHSIEKGEIIAGEAGYWLLRVHLDRPEISGWNSMTFFES